MAYPTAAGFRDIAASTMRYVPEIWSGKLLVKFYEATVLAAISNTDYSGDISEQGNTVWIRTTPDITIRTHVKGQTLTHEQPSSAPDSLLIDKGRYWAFVTNKIDDKQTDLKNYVDLWSTDASEQMKISIDTDVLADIFADAHASNQGATAGVRSSSINLGVSGAPLQITKANVTDIIVDMGTVLDEQDVPEEGRFIVFPPWVCGLIKKSDLKDASLAGDGTSILRNGRVGMIDRFVVFMSNLLATTVDGSGPTATNIIFGTRHALTFASQLTESEMVQNPWGFGYLHRGLQVFGYKVLKSQALGWLYAYK